MGVLEYHQYRTSLGVSKATIAAAFQSFAGQLSDLVRDLMMVPDPTRATMDFRDSYYLAQASEQAIGQLAQRIERECQGPP